MHAAHYLVDQLGLPVVFRMVQVMVQEEQYILLAVVNRELAAVQVVQGPSFRGQQKTHDH